MKCIECGKSLTNEEDCYGHDCEVPEVVKIKPVIGYCPNCFQGYDYIKYRRCPKCKQKHK